MRSRKEGERGKNCILLLNNVVVYFILFSLLLFLIIFILYYYYYYYFHMILFFSSRICAHILYMISRCTLVIHYYMLYCNYRCRCLLACCHSNFIYFASRTLLKVSLSHCVCLQVIGRVERVNERKTRKISEMLDR